MQNQCSKKKTILMSTFMILLLLFIPFASAFSTHEISSTRTKSDNVLKSLYGGGGVDVYIDEISGTPDNPTYQPLSNVTVKIWHTWFFRGDWYIRFIQKCITGSTFFTEEVESFILNISLDSMELTNEEGYFRVYMYGTCLLWLFYPIKEGYHVCGSTPFKNSLGGGGIWETIRFIMAED